MKAVRYVSLKRSRRVGLAERGKKCSEPDYSFAGSACAACRARARREWEAVLEADVLLRQDSAGSRRWSANSGTLSAMRQVAAVSHRSTDYHRPAAGHSRSQTGESPDAETQRSGTHADCPGAPAEASGGGALELWARRIEQGSHQTRKQRVGYYGRQTASHQHAFAAHRDRIGQGVAGRG